MPSPWGFSCFTSGTATHANPGGQMCDKSQVQLWGLSENTCSVKGKFSFCYKTNKDCTPSFSLFLPALGIQNTELRTPEAPWLPFQEAERGSPLIRGYELCIFIFLGCSALENSGNEHGTTRAAFVELGVCSSRLLHEQLSHQIGRLLPQNWMSTCTP